MPVATFVVLTFKHFSRLHHRVFHKLCSILVCFLHGFFIFVERVRHVVDRKLVFREFLRITIASFHLGMDCRVFVTQFFRDAVAFQDVVEDIFLVVIKVSKNVELSDVVLHISELRFVHFFQGFVHLADINVVVEVKIKDLVTHEFHKSLLVRLDSN